MISKADIKRIRSLFLKKFRDEYGLFIVEGEKMVQEALESTLFEVIETYRKNDIGEDIMSRISQLSTPSPILAVVKKPAEIKAGATPVSGDIVIGLDSVRDPGNMGTIIRIADWFGISTIYASEDCVDLYNSKTIQSTMGSLFRVRVVYCDLKKIVSQYRADGLEVFGTFLDGSNIYRESLSERGMIIFGNESVGISPELSGLISRKLMIPHFPEERIGPESLNVAIATAIVCSEFRRKS